MLAAAIALLWPDGTLPLLVVPAAGAGVLARASVDRARWALWCGIGVVLALITTARALPLPAVTLPDPLAGLRAVLAGAIYRLVPDPEGAVVAGIALGERAAIGRDLSDAFARSGTAHLLAVSGFNMTLVAGAVALGLRGRLPLKAVALITAAALGGYALLVGPSPSVLRAGVMALVASLGLALGRPSLSANALCLSVAVLTAIDPGIATAIGFQLSVAATAGLIALQARLAQRLARLPSILREGLATTLAASVPTVPIIAAAFGRISLVSPLANLLAVPLFAPLLALGMATAAVGAISDDAARPLGIASYAVATALRRLVELAASLPGASADLPRGPGSGLILALAAVAVVAARRQILVAALSFARVSLRAIGASLPPRGVVARRVLRIAAGGAVVALVIAASLVALRGSPTRLRALDVGQGDAFLLEHAGAVVLIDGGPDPRRLLALLGGSLAPWQRRIDAVILTHAHTDHGAGLLAVFGRYDVGLAIEPRGLEDVPLSRLWAESTARAGVPRRAVGAGERLRIGAIEITVLAPNEDPRVEYRCLVLRVRYAGVTALFTGDATDAALADLLLDPPSLRADIYVPPHHGAETPHAVALVQAVRPSVALLSVGASNRYGHPTPSVLSALAAVAAYRTDRHGTVEVAVDGSRLLVRTTATDLPPPRGRSVPDPAAPR